MTTSLYKQEEVIYHHCYRDDTLVARCLALDISAGSSFTPG